MRNLLLLCFLGFGTSVLAQTRITGKVVDSEDNTPVAGATVLVQGTTIGVSTDMNGMYTLTLPGGGGEI